MLKSKQETLLKLEKKNQGPVTCLGMTFENDEKRREHFIERLREKLKDPEFRKIEGFPIGEDEDILAISDPPYYTACPNPWLNDFIEQEGKPYDQEKDNYHREPYAFDVSEGKNDPIYNAHTYHTKVPHKAIMRYILHYTEPGDIVLDGFAGTGMTGVAAQMCRMQEKVIKAQIENERKKNDLSQIQWGDRKVILNDLSPAASFISFNYNAAVDTKVFAKQAEECLEIFNEKYGWMYTTLHNPSKQQLYDAITEIDNTDANSAYFPFGKINFTILSEVIRCPNCGEEALYWDIAVDRKTRYKKERKTPLQCSKCESENKYIEWERVVETYFDSERNKIDKRVKYLLVLINYKYQGVNYEKSLDSFDYEVLRRIEEEKINNWIPIEELPRGDKTNGIKNANHIRYTHQFYTKRNLISISFLYNLARKKLYKRHLLYWIQSVGLGFTKLNRYLAASYSQVNRYLKGTLYVAPFITEVSPSYSLTGKIKRLSKTLISNGESSTIQTTQSSTMLQINPNTIDYIFTDPPFGGNIMYSELNYLWETWLKVLTNNTHEAIENNTQHKSLANYQNLMMRCFREYYRVLKPGRWMTVEFHNSKNRVWTAIQESIMKARFVVADVRILDKEQMSMNQFTAIGAVKQDLVISCYKPSESFTSQFEINAGTEVGVWDFIVSHFEQLPVAVMQNGMLDIVTERMDFLLFDRMVAFHVQRGISVPMNASEFYAGLRERYPERDGMFFLPEQVAEYDKARMKVSEVGQLVLFVVDEKSAIQWLRKRLENDRATYQDLHPEFLQELHQIKHEKMPELMTILEQNFLKDNKDCWYVPDVARAEDLEKIREKHLMREFWTYLPKDYKPQPEVMQFSLLGNGERPTAGLSGKKIKIVRTEAVRVGFKTCWTERDYKTIIVTAERLPKNIIQEDPDLLMYYDNALMRVGD